MDEFTLTQSPSPASTPCSIPGSPLSITLTQPISPSSSPSSPLSSTLPSLSQSSPSPLTSHSSPPLPDSLSSNLTGYYCYLLRSLSTPQSLATYIGFSTDPFKRLRQHNGELVSGAFKTSKYRPWKHAVIVGGFQNKNLALQFEWQWQHPSRSRHMKDFRGGAESLGKPVGPHKKLRLLMLLLGMRLWRRLSLFLVLTDASYFSLLRDLLLEFQLDKAVHLYVLSHEQLSLLSLNRLQSQQSLSGFKSLGTKALPVGISLTQREGRESNRTSHRLRSPQEACIHCPQDLNERFAFRPGDSCWNCPECGQAVHLYCLGQAFLKERLSFEFSFPSSTSSVSSTSSFPLVPPSAVCSRCKTSVPWSEMLRKYSYSLEGKETNLKAGVPAIQNQEVRPIARHPVPSVNLLSSDGEDGNSVPPTQFLYNLCDD